MFENLILVKGGSIRKNVKYVKDFSDVLFSFFFSSFLFEKQCFVDSLTLLDMLLCDLYLEIIIKFVSFLGLSNLLKQYNLFVRTHQPTVKFAISNCKSEIY